MPSFEVKTAGHRYDAMVERGLVSGAGRYLPPQAGKVFVATTKDVWLLHGNKLASGLEGHWFTPLFFENGEGHKRLSSIEQMAEEMVVLGADRTSVVIAFGGGVTGDMGGLLAAIFMRGIPVIQVPTTLLAQVDASVGGKTGVNLVRGKNLIGSFHQPASVLIDPEVLATLPEREYRAGLYEVLKHGVIASEELFDLMANRSGDVLAKQPSVVDRMICESVRIKAEVVSADEREGGLRRILNFGHTVGHALEAETHYTHFLHGEAVALGMRAASHLASNVGFLDAAGRDRILEAIDGYGPIPAVKGISAEKIAARLVNDKKSVKGAVHFVLPDRIGHVQVVSGISADAVLSSIHSAMQ